MAKQIIYLKETSSYDDILKKEHNKLPLFLKKIVFLYKNMFNIVTKKRIDDVEIWVLPFKEKYYINKLRKIISKLKTQEDKIYLISNELKANNMCQVMEEYSEEYIKEEKIKKALLVYIIEYICSMQEKEIADLDLTILVNNTSNINMYLIEKLAKQVKTLKIVSLHINKFKKLEERLYNEEGIPIQFSNSYKKSLKKSEIIINLDFNELEINEYDICNNAIIVNCIDNNVKIKSRLFNGIIINSCDIEYKKEIINIFKEIKIYENYTKLMLCASLIENEDNIFKIYNILEENNIKIVNLIGNSGNINKNEFKNVAKKLDKY